MKYLYIFLLVALTCSRSIAQTDSPLCFVEINLRSAPNKTSEVVAKLSQYDNLQIIEFNDENWAKVKFNSNAGYVWKSYLKKGRAIVSSYEVRTGARCKDGKKTTSSATGRGACSHHGGVSYWLTRTKHSVRIEDN